MPPGPSQPAALPSDSALSTPATPPPSFSSSGSKRLPSANRTIVWSANRKNPVPSDSKLVLTNDGHLTLEDPSGQVVWIASATGGPHAAILDSGNLVLVCSTSTDWSIEWQSLQVLSMGTDLWSKLTDANYSDRQFQMATSSPTRSRCLRGTGTTMTISVSRLSDCFYAVVTYKRRDCAKKKLPLSNGRWEASIGSKSLIKVPKANITRHSNICKPQPPISIEEKHDGRTLILTVSSPFGGLVLIILFFIAAIFLPIFKSNNTRDPKIEPDSSMQWGLSLRLFTYMELEEATKGFGEELGSGAFGTVYKGVLPLGSETRAYIAVKKLHDLLKETEKEFSNEVRSIGQTHHKNLVKLLGFCNEGTHRLLVYEYMSNGTLTGFLLGMSRPDWNQRAQIALGIARGLLYLHAEC